jgi:hypothetical protein
MSLDNKRQLFFHGVTSSSGPSQFPSKVVHLCGNGKHNPLVKSHPESCCFQIYPHLRTEGKGPKNASASFAQATSLQMIASLVSNNFFIVDSEATHHMIRNRSLFTNLAACSTEIKTGNPDAPVFAHGRGTAVIHIDGADMTLKNCLFVPSISQQLLSLVQLLEDSICITRHGNTFSLKHQSGILMRGVICGGLLLVTASSVPWVMVALAQ